MFDFQLPDGWQWVTVEDVQSSEKRATITGPFGSSIGKRFFVDEGVPVIRGNNLKIGAEKFVDDGFVFITEEKANELKGYKAYPGDILFTAAGTIGQVGIIPDNCKFEYYIISNKQMRARFDPERVDSGFAYYWFSSKPMVDYIKVLNTGSTIPLINLGVLRKLPMPLPPLEEQKRIKKYLVDLDDKIELNRQTNQTLEQIAQAIFDSWFVNFEPVKAKIKAKKRWQALNEIIETSSPTCYAEEFETPDPNKISLQEAMTQAAMCVISGKTEEQLKGLDEATLQQLKTTADLFPDALVESELGEIPEGWKVGSIGEIAKAKGGYAFKGNSFVEEGNPVVKIKNITGDGRVDLDGTVCIDDAQAKMAERFKLNDGDLLMAMTGATVAKIGFVVTVGKSVYLNQRVAKFESEKFGSKISWFLYCCFQRDSIFDSVVGAAQGSAQPNISSTGIESTKLVLPSDNLIVEFCDHADSLFRKWLSNINENFLLEENRDVLLLKLLSGKIDLPVDQTTTKAVA